MTKQIPMLPLSLTLALQATIGQQSTTYNPLSLNVQVMSSDSYGNSAGILPDNIGSTYVDGVQGVCANFDKYGNLIVNFACTQTSATRNLWFIMTNPHAATSCSTSVSASPPNPQTTGISYTNYLSTVPATDLGPNTHVALQNLQPGTSECIQLGTLYTFKNKQGTSYRLAYHRISNNTGFWEIPNTPYAVVTRSGDGSYWNVEPDYLSSCNAGKYVNVPDVITTPTVGPFNFEDCGTYTVPFRFILTPKQWPVQIENSGWPAN
jgi:hypothetical protein